MVIDSRIPLDLWMQSTQSDHHYKKESLQQCLILATFP
jgi:hypothetical protein